MDGNIGWKYNKEYFYSLRGDASKGNLLKAQNDELLGIRYNVLHLEQFLETINNDNNIFRVELTTSYPGLITGIGINHQTTLKWMSTTGGNPAQIPEFKLGMTFDYTTGVPIIPGSSIKGVLRSYFPIMNQNKFCDCYNEKVDYIAAILHKVHKLVLFLRNEEIEKRRIRNKLIIDSGEVYKLKTKEELLSEFKKQRENEILEMEISDDEFETLSSEKALTDFAEKCLEKYEIEKIESLYQAYNRNTKRTLERGITESYENEISKILNLSLEEEEVEINDKVNASFIAKEMFEGKKKDGDFIPMYQRDVFYDAVPVSGDANADGKLFANDYITPHKSQFKDPEPICFMKIRPNVKFMFCFTLNDGVVSKEEKLMLIKYLLYMNGLGAKTNVGYGQFRFSKNEMLKMS